MYALPGEDGYDELGDELLFDAVEIELLGISLEKAPKTEEKPTWKDARRPSGKLLNGRDQPRILVAEDDDEMRVLLFETLRREGYKVTACPDGLHLEDRLIVSEIGSQPTPFELIISDIRMPGLSGLEVLEGLQTCEASPPTILITAFGDEETHAQARQLGAAAVFDKPFDLDDLLARVRDITPPHPP